MSGSHLAYPPGAGGGSSSDRLSILTASPISVTGTTTATISRMHYVTGTTADYTITLPTTVGNASKHIGFVFGPTTVELSKLVTIDGNSTELINGIQSRIFWAGEALELECDGSNWWVVNYKFLPMECTMTKDTQNIATSSQTKVTLDTTLYDNTGLMASTTGNKIVCRRTNRYSICSQTLWNPTLAVVLLQAFPKVNGVAQRVAERNCPAGSFVSCEITEKNVAITAGQDIELFAGNFSAGTETTAPNTLEVSEQDGW